MDRESVLQGVVQDSAREQLDTKLKALCRVLHVPFQYREIVFKPPPPQQQQDPGPELRARCDLRTPKKEWYTCPWTSPHTLRTLCSISPLMVKAKSNVSVRSHTQVKVSDNILSFLEALGYSYAFEYIREGTESVAFMKDRAITVSVSSIKPVSGSSAEGFLKAVGNSLLVEVSTLSTDEDVTAASEDLLRFAEYLAPIVRLSKVDTREIKPGAMPRTLLAPAQPPPREQHPVHTILPPAKQIGTSTNIGISMQAPAQRR